MKNIFLYSNILLLSACVNNDKPTQPQIEVVRIYSNYLDRETDSLAKKAIIYGDTNAYWKLKGYYYFQMNKTNEFYFYAYQMATLYHYKEAYFDLYHIFSLRNKKIKFDSCNYNMAMFYLLKAHENGGSVENYLKAEFRQNKIPSSKSYRKKFCY
ncbi:MAG: hypothetical protein ACEQSR_01135 [Candidatus Methylacidiphilales bacterium]